MTLVHMFPGQTSRYAGMVLKAAGLSARNRRILAAASDVLHRNLASHYREDNPDAYRCNRDVQVGVFLTSHMFLQALDDAGVRADLSLGLSLGEYNHLVHIGALDFRDALWAVERRGLAYDAGPRGWMAAVFPIEREELEAIARRASGRGVVEVVNLNSPRQHVLAGERAAIEEAMRIVETETSARAVVTEREVPMHSSLLEAVGRTFRRTLATLPFAVPQLPYLPNRLGCVLERPGRGDFVELLATHVHEPVLWRRSVDHVVRRRPDAVFVEVGPKTVLYDLLNPRWHRCPRFHTDSPGADTAAHLEALVRRLRALAGWPTADRTPRASCTACGD
jgi:[acyl-carrier-protein] S-malonyltransferase